MCGGKRRRWLVKMPKKKLTYEQRYIHNAKETDARYNAGYNDAIDECTLAIAEAVPSVEEIDLFLKERWNHLFSPEENYLGRRRLSQSIHKLYEDRLKGGG